MRKKYLMMGVLTLCVALGCIFLPSRILSLMDGQKLNQVRTEETQEVALSTQEQLGLAGKIELLTGGQANTILMNSGKNYTRDEMETHVWEELARLQELGILSEDMPKVGATGLSAIFFLNVENGNESMILWEITLNLERPEGGSFGLGLMLDDATGKILSLRTLWADTPWGEEELFEAGETEEWTQMAELWGEYLGVHLITAETQEGDLMHEVAGSMTADGQLDEKKIKELRKAGFSEEEIAEKLGVEGTFSYTEAIYRQGTDQLTVTYYFGRENGYFYIIFNK